MNLLESTARLLFDADAYATKCAELTTVTAERDAALQRVAALEEQLQAMANDRKFYYDMATGNDARRKAKRARGRA